MGLPRSFQTLFKNKTQATPKKDSFKNNKRGPQGYFTFLKKSPRALKTFKALSKTKNKGLAISFQTLFKNNTKDP